MRRIILVFTFLVLLLIIAGIFHKAFRTRHLSLKIDQVQQGMRSETVLQLIGKPDSILVINENQSLYVGSTLWYYKIGNENYGGYKIIFDTKADSVLLILSP